MPSLGLKWRERRNQWIVGLLICMSVVGLVADQAAWSQKSSDLAAALARLRSEVEQLSSQIDEKKQYYQSRLRSISMRRSSMELNVQRARLQLAQLQRKQEKQQKEIAASGEKEASLRPVITKMVSVVRDAVKDGLPFRIGQRIKALDDIERQLKKKLVRPIKAASRLWQFVEDELRLARENGIYRQIINLDGKKQLVDIARLGMVMLFFKTKDGKYGAAVKQGGKWKFDLVLKKEDKEQVMELFVALKQKIRVGFRQLPNRLQTK